MDDSSYIVQAIADHLTESDSAELWDVVLCKVIADARRVFASVPPRKNVVFQVGCCSRWLAPNKFRWLAKSGQFTAPAGYLVRGRFLRGIPEFDWDATFELD